MEIEYSPARSPASRWSRLPGGTRRSSRRVATSIYSSFRLARRTTSAGSRLDAPVSYSCFVCRSANVAINRRTVTGHVTLVNSSAVVIPVWRPAVDQPQRHAQPAQQTAFPMGIDWGIDWVPGGDRWVYGTVKPEFRSVLEHFRRAYDDGVLESRLRPSTRRVSGTRSWAPASRCYITTT